VNILGIYGSPRKNGNSDIVLNKVLEGAAESGAVIQKLYARNLKNLSGCRECGACEKDGICVVKDDMQQVYPLFEDADVILLASPIFFYGLTAQLKALIDRSQAMWSRRMLNKPREEWKNYESGRGYLIAVGATKGQNLFEGVKFVAKYFYDALDMSYEGGLFYKGLEGKEDAGNNPEITQAAAEFGRNLGINT